MTDLFQGGSSPTRVPAPAALPKQGGSSPHTPSVPGLAIHPNPLPAETPTTAKPVTFTAPITAPDKSTATAPDCGVDGKHFETGPLSPHHASQVEANRTPGMNPAMNPKPVPAAQDAGTAAGRAVVSGAEASKSNALFRVLSRDGR